MTPIKANKDKNGRLLIPSFFCQSLHLELGEQVLLYQEGTELKIRTFKDSLQQARDLIKKYR